MDRSEAIKRNFKDLKKPKQLENASPVIFCIVLIVAVQAFLVFNEIPEFVFPKPTGVAAAFAVSWLELGRNMLITLEEIFIGYIFAVILGIVIAIMITQFSLVNSALTPYTVFLATMPMIALIPLLMIWLGFGIKVRIIVVVLQAFPVVMMNAATGFNNVDTLKLELMKSLGATRIQKLSMVIIPDAMPHIFTGLRLAGIFATTAAICAEFSGGTEGLGVLIITATSYAKMSIAFAGILLVAATGVSLYGIIKLLEKKIVKA